MYIKGLDLGSYLTFEIIGRKNTKSKKKIFTVGCFFLLEPPIYTTFCTFLTENLVLFGQKCIIFGANLSS